MRRRHKSRVIVRELDGNQRVLSVGQDGRSTDHAAISRLLQDNMQIKG